MEKRRVKLDVNGVVCGLITEETDEYMQGLGREVGDMMSKIQQSAPMMTREGAAVMTALNFIDEAKKADEKVQKMKERLTETERKALELERRSVELQKENKQLWEETEALLKQPAGALDESEKEKLEKRVFELEKENDRLRRGGENIEAPVEEKREKIVPMKNPLRDRGDSQQNFVSYFEKSDE